MTTDQDDFPARLIKARSALGWSQLDLSKASGVAAAQISRYEQASSTPRPQVVAKLANALNVSFEWLFAGESVAPSQSRVGRLNIPLSLELIAKLEVAAMNTGKTLAEEAEDRLRSTFPDAIFGKTQWLASESDSNQFPEHLRRIHERLDDVLQQLDMRFPVSSLESEGLGVPSLKTSGPSASPAPKTEPESEQTTVQHRRRSRPLAGPK